MALIPIVLVPVLTETPLGVIVTTQPDLGVVLLFGAVAGPMGKYCGLVTAHGRSTHVSGNRP